MANFGCLPHEILEKILEFLPLRDQINSGFVCSHWSKGVGWNLKHVTIDPSMPFGGRWVEENMRWINPYERQFPRYDFPNHAWGIRYEETDLHKDYHYPKSYREGLQEVKIWYRDENDPADQEMKKLIPKLCKLTNQIETLNIENYHLDTESLTELLLSQTAIKSLRIKIANLPAWVKNVYFEKIFEVIIRQQETIEEIEIKIDTTCDDLEMFQGTITNIQDIITCKGRLSFPKLKSLKLGNIHNHNYTAITQLHDDLFQSLIATSQLEELQFPTTFLDTSFNATIEDCIKNGSLVALKKCWLFYREENAEELIKHCPNITHLTGDWEEKENPSDYARGVLKITSTYGPKLKSFRCMVSRMEAVNAILEECTNLESLVLDYSSPELGNDRPIIESLPLFGYLEKLTELKLRFGFSDYYPIIEAEIVCELIKRCGMNLQSLKLQVNGYETHKILNAIGANCKNLKKLELQIYDKMKDTRGATKEKIRQLQESAVAILEGCQNLKTLYLDISGSDELGCNDIIYDQIGNKLPHLQHLTLADLMKYPTPSLVKLIHALPYCNIEMVMT